MASGHSDRKVSHAQIVADILLHDLPQRRRHTVGVAARVEDLLDTVDSGDHDILRAAAWLHDIGYSALTRHTGFHFLDGARYLAVHGWSGRLCGLVAHHSGARFLAEDLGLTEELSRYDMEESPVADALLYADQTVGPDGTRMTVAERIAEKLARHGPGLRGALDAHRERDRVQQPRHTEHGVLAGWLGAVDAFVDPEP